MPLLGEAQYLSTDELLPGLLENWSKEIPGLECFPFYEIRGNALTAVATDALPDAGTIGYGSPLLDQTTIPNVPITYPFIDLATSFRISVKALDTCSGTNNLVLIQIKLAIQRLLYKFFNLLEIGNPAINPNEFAGLKKLVDPFNVVNLGGTPLTLEAVDRAKGYIRTSEMKNKIITNTTGYILYREAVHNAGISFSNFEDWPICLNDQQPTCSACGVDTTNMWFVSLGLNGLCGIIPPKENGSMFRIRQVYDPDNGTIIVFVTWPVSISLATKAALSAVVNIAITP
ncbi:hypothetical protein ACFOQM_10550 [Paenibacillus sp. GCM10012307]|uniref:Uncharacterized protein n=1 Tax=Paenibacillus roseus TaxID=2798579 RepID=A0A934MV45_9BACL|nr:hypothetical protein [Paenibacillus roseus]MBJ6361722.1 hypothetical protein [Paenibacillus roseus]